MLKWYKRLGFKIFLQGALLFVLLSLALGWHNRTLTAFLENSNRTQATSLGESVSQSILSFILQVPGGGGQIDSYIENLNARLDGIAVIRMVHSASIDHDFVPEEEETPRHAKEAESLKDGTVRSYETEDSCVYISPVTTVEGCGKCHFMPDGSGLPVPAGYPIGLVVAEVSTALMHAESGALFKSSIQLMAIVAIFILLQTFFISNRMSRPLAKMVETIDTFTQGDLNRRTDIDQEDEIGELAQDFNTMADRIENNVEELESWNRRLESEVDIQTRTVMEQAEKITEMRDYYRAVLESTPNIIFTTDRNLTIDFVYGNLTDHAKRAGFTLTKEEICGSPLPDFLQSPEKDEYKRICMELIADADKNRLRTHRNEFCLGNSDDPLHTYLTISPILDSGHRTLGLVFILQDVTKRVKAEKDVALEKEKLNAVMHGMGASVMMLDDRRKILFANKEMEENFGSDLISKICSDALNPHAGPCNGCQVATLGDQARTIEHRTADGRFYLITQTRLGGAEGERRVIEVIEDITYLKQMEEQLRELTITDNLTGLFNKRHFWQKLTEEIARSRRHGTSLALLFMDIDKFKHFNDTYGHIEGDRCLEQLGATVQNAIRTHIDSGYRYGGEEFTVLLPGANRLEAEKVAERIRKMFNEKVFTPMVNDKPEPVRKSISIGLAIYQGEEAGLFVERADVAMYTAKRKGGNRIQNSTD